MKIKKQHEVIEKKEFPDSIELGTPSKGGVLKVYFDSSKIDEARQRIDNAAMILNYATAVKMKLEVKEEK